jgi:uridine phosphorylase
MNLNVQGGDLIVAMSAVRDEGTSAEYMPISYPATASFAVCTALAQQAEAMSVPYHVGVVQSKDSFYGETNPETMPISEKLLARWEAHMKLGCLASEMECAAIFSVCATRNARASAVLLAIWNVEREKQGLESIISMDTESAIKCAVGAIRNLIAHDSKQLTIENGKLTIAEKQNQTRPSLPNSSNNGVFM